MYSETCMNRSCSKVDTLLRRTDTSYPVCFLYAFLSRFSKAETIKRTLRQNNNFFSLQIKKPPALHGCKLGISDKERINVHFCQFWFCHFWFYFAVLKECNIFDLNSGSFIPSCSLQSTNSFIAPLKEISDRDLQAILHPFQ